MSKTINAGIKNYSKNIRSTSPNAPNANKGYNATIYDSNEQKALLAATMRRAEENPFNPS